MEETRDLQSLERMIDERVSWNDLKTALQVKWALVGYHDGSVSRLDALGKAIELQIAGSKTVSKRLPKSYNSFTRKPLTNEG